MSPINYHHLFYFYVAAREGSVTRASEKLFLTQPTLSSQIGKLERDLGEKLFIKVGRNLRLSERGRLVFGYAEEIFGLGREMIDALEGRSAGRPSSFRVGVVDALPKLVAYRLLEPAFNLPNPPRITCREGKLEKLLAELSVHEVDLVLSDLPVEPPIKIRAYNHLLGECDLTLFATADLAGRFAEGFPSSLEGAPFLLPTEGTAMRYSLELFFEKEGVRPELVAEIEDGALIKAFGQAGQGIFAAPSVIENEVSRQYRVNVVGRLPAARERFYAISVERRIKNPAVAAIAEAAKTRLFEE